MRRASVTLIASFAVTSAMAADTLGTPRACAIFLAGGPTAVFKDDLAIQGIEDDPTILIHNDQLIGYEYSCPWPPSSSTTTCEEGGPAYFEMSISAIPKGAGFDISLENEKAFLVRPCE